MKIRNDQTRIANKDIQVNDVVSMNFKVVRNGKCVGYDHKRAPVTRIGATSFWVVNPHTGKEEATNINTFKKRFFFNGTKNIWEFLVVTNRPNFDYI